MKTVENTRSKSRYAKKQQGSVERKNQTNHWCKTCLCRHCSCGVDTSGHFIPSKQQVEACYG